MGPAVLDFEAVAEVVQDRSRGVVDGKSPTSIGVDVGLRQCSGLTGILDRDDMDWVLAGLFVVNFFVSRPLHRALVAGSGCRWGCWGLCGRELALVLSRGSSRHDGQGGRVR